MSKDSLVVPGWAALGRNALFHYWTWEGKKACDTASFERYEGPKEEPTVSACCVMCLRVYAERATTITIPTRAR